MNNSSNTPETPSAETTLNFKLLLPYLLKKWWVFAISLIVITGCALLYLKVTNASYTSYAKVMFNQNEDEEGGSRSALSSLMASFSMGNSGVNVIDEILRMQSHSAIKRVVQTLDLNKDYSASTSMFRPDIIYFQNSPIEIETAPGMLDTISEDTEFRLKISDKGKKLHLKVKQGSYKQVFNADIPKLPYVVKTPLGNFTLTPTAFYRPEQNMTFKADLSNADEAANSVFNFVDVYLSDKKANAVDIKVDDVNNKRARAIANTLIDLYNQYSVADRSAQNKATLDFLNDRLHRLYSNLNDAGKDIANYKERNQIVDAKSESAYILKMKEITTSSLIDMETQLGILNMLHEFLTNDNNKQSLIPVTSIPGAGSESTNASINKYNELVLEMLRIQASAKGNNTTLRLLENQIEAMRSNMLTGLERNIKASQIAIERAKSANGTVDKRINSIPRMEQELTNLMRDNEIQNRIYAYLLQKREEAEVKLARTLPTGKIIDEAWTDSTTRSPNRILVLCAALMLGLIIPFCILLSSFRNKFVASNAAKTRKEEEEIDREIG